MSAALEMLISRWAGGVPTDPGEPLKGQEKRCVWAARRSHDPVRSLLLLRGGHVQRATQLHACCTLARVQHVRDRLRSEPFN